MQRLRQPKKKRGKKPRISGTVKTALRNVGYSDASGAHAPGIKMTSSGALFSSVAVGYRLGRQQNVADEPTPGKLPEWATFCGDGKPGVKPRTFRPWSVLIFELRLFDTPDAFRKRAQVLLVVNPEEVHPSGKRSVHLGNEEKFPCRWSSDCQYGKQLQISRLLDARIASVTTEVSTSPVGMLR